MQLRTFILAVLCLPSLLFAQKTETGEKIEEVEIDFLGSYYEQDGIHSAVEGGEGTQFLNDNVGMVVINVPFLEKNSINMSLGLDVYTSASTDMIDMQKTGASHQDERAYGNLAYTRLTDNLGDLTVGGGFSTEWDVNSTNFNLGWSFTTPNLNQTFGLKTMGIFDKWDLIYPAEMRYEFNDINPSSGLETRNRNTLGASFSYAQILSKKFQASFNYDLVVQQGLLSTPFHRVYMDSTGFESPSSFIPKSLLTRDDILDIVDKDIERLPGKRVKHALAMRTSWYATNSLIIKTFSRVYTDDFGINALTLSAEVPVKFNRFVSVSPFYRYYIQSESDYFKPIFQHVLSDEFRTSDYDLSGFTSQKYGVGLRVSPPFGIYSTTGITKNRTSQLKFIELRYSQYHRSDGLDAFIISAGIGFVL